MYDLIGGSSALPIALSINSSARVPPTARWIPLSPNPAPLRALSNIYLSLWLPIPIYLGRDWTIDGAQIYE